ncbi:hypothetical protein AK812_SmicGene38026 [Symbiodinium microadriaticum]|uniref:Uncharacterized protein n=1 Tax=Symbiodinium microadriaticum TaxID=2951 RepID=A0A1Q9CEU4_SYMMI|nr:hypothetical protein AK812_SmicGene38026 [Symbiodinium microadriaticum]
MGDVLAKEQEGRLVARCGELIDECNPLASLKGVADLCVEMLLFGRLDLQLGRATPIVELWCTSCTLTLGEGRELFAEQEQVIRVQQAKVHRLQVAKAALAVEIAC